jgi:hypothetical protein
MTGTKEQDEDNSSEARGTASTCDRIKSQSEVDRQLERVLARVPPIITLPKPKTRCPYTGRARTGLLELIAPCERNNFHPPVKAIYRRAHKYAQRGQWLIPAENLFRYLFGLAEHSTEDYLDTAKTRDEARKEREP